MKIEENKTFFISEVQTTQLTVALN